MPRLSEKYNEDESRDEIQDILRSHHIKATAQRRALLKLLHEEKAPLSLPQIHRKSPRESLASVYRTLELFVSKGFVNVINTGSREVAYELVYGKKHHHHLICTGCGSLEDVDGCGLRGAERQLLTHSKKFATLSHHSLEFFGMCMKCAPAT